jgi:hypothetical protein
VAAIDAEPPAPDALRVKVVVLDTETTLVPEVVGLSAPTPLSTVSEDASVTFQLRVLVPPAGGSVAGRALKAWICGFGALLLLPPLLEPQAREKDNSRTSERNGRISGPRNRIPSEAI